MRTEKRRPWLPMLLLPAAMSLTACAQQRPLVVLPRVQPDLPVELMTKPEPSEGYSSRALNWLKKVAGALENLAPR